MFIKLFNLIAVLFVFAGTTVISAQSINTPKKNILSEKQYSLSKRYDNAFVNDVFSDNILLTLAYMRGVAKEGTPVDWSKVKGNFTYNLVIKPGQTFAFHNTVLPEYKDSVTHTTNAHFNAQQGFRSDGWLMGDGVCHLASFMNVVARDAGLDVVSPTRHDFAAIPEVPKDYGVSIYYTPSDVITSSTQNMYITNNKDKAVTFAFTYEKDSLKIQAYN